MKGEALDRTLWGTRIGEALNLSWDRLHDGNDDDDSDD